ncbi:MAG: 2-amino-4-hydroxy-6-hydroxymethyldihydropteridine diphosphokinase [Gammaproteobacteria bacterium]|nr:2-amino-4-hydroxy-6-hydroxymethyldihydropteridine diphosphokinase [Gammaproteobacteria bacterium]
MTAAAAPIDAATATTAYIGIGSNLEQPVHQVLQARDALARLPNTRLLEFSPLYRNPALGPGRQPDYVNAVAAIETRLAAHELLDALQAVEANQGRVRGSNQWAPRTLDLDLLLYGDSELGDECLTVPHPRLAQRAFVLKPLLDIAPNLDVPGLGPVTMLLSKLSEASLQRIGETEMVIETRDDAL